MKSFSGLLYESFLQVNGWLLSVLGIGIGLGTFFFSPNTTVPIGWLALSTSISLLLLVVGGNAARTAWTLSQRGLPEVKRTLEPPKIYADIERILIVAPSDLFSPEMLVSLYLKDDDYERLIAVGRVVTVQSNGFLQVGVSTFQDSGVELREKLNGNDATFLKKLLVKPSVPSYILQRTINE